MQYRPTDSAPHVRKDRGNRLAHSSARLIAALLALTAIPCAAQNVGQISTSGTSAANISISVPFSWNLYQSGKSSLIFNTLFRYDPTIAASNETRLLSSLDWVGNTRFLTNSILTSGL